MLAYDAGIPKSVILGIAVFVCMAVIGLYVTRASYPAFIRKSAWTMLAGYSVLVLSSTIMFRTRSLIQPKPEWELWDTWPNHLQLAQMILNIILFMPIGFLLGAAMKSRNILMVLLLGCLFSLVIESIQFLTYSGVCNVNDVLHNTAGCIVGYGLFLLCYLVIGGIKKMKEQT